jgi:hypothetical protein
VEPVIFEILAGLVVGCVLVAAASFCFGRHLREGRYGLWLLLAGLTACSVFFASLRVFGLGVLGSLPPILVFLLWAAIQASGSPRRRDNPARSKARNPLED